MSYEINIIVVFVQDQMILDHAFQLNLLYVDLFIRTSGSEKNHGMVWQWE